MRPCPAQARRQKRLPRQTSEPAAASSQGSRGGRPVSSSSFTTSGFASSSFATSDSEGAEFEVAAAPDWDQDESATDQATGDDDKV